MKSKQKKNPKFFLEQYIGAVYLWSLAYFSSLEESFGWIRDDEKDSF